MESLTVAIVICGSVLASLGLGVAVWSLRGGGVHRKEVGQAAGPLLQHIHVYIYDRCIYPTCTYTMDSPETR